MSEKYKFHDQEGIYFTTSTIVHWIDLFTRKEFKHIIVNALNYCQQEKGLIIYAWCLMPSHLHMIIGTNKGKLSDTLRDFKKHTNKEIIKELNLINESRKEWLIRAFQKAGNRLKRIKSNKIWQDGNHPILLNSAKMVNEKLLYIHSNPVKDEIVDEASYYWYSSARDYEGLKGLIPITHIN